MPRLPLDPSSGISESFTRRLLKKVRKGGRGASKAIMRSRSVTLPSSFPVLPVRLRPWFVLFTSLIMVVLAILGFTNIANGWHINDKVLHFVCLGFASGVFYFIFDVDEDARRIWFWRYSGLMASSFICLFLGGIVSEIVQSLLPYKRFEFGDVVANLLGASLGLYISFHIESYYRKRREIARLYKPLHDDGGGSTDDEDETGPLFSPTSQHPAASAPTVVSNHGRKPSFPPIQFKNVWDDRMDVFDIGEDEDDEENTPLRGSGKV